MRNKTKKTEPIKISSSLSSRTNKKRVFSDDENFEKDDELNVVDTRQGHHNTEEGDDDEPEVVRANDNSLMALREVHQNVSLLNSVNKKKIKKARITSEHRKSENTIDGPSVDALEKLDESVIDAINFSQDDEDQGRNVNGNTKKVTEKNQHTKVIPQK